MDALNNNDIKIVDLADEILLMILKKLDHIDVLHSIVYVNRRFQELALDPLYIRDLYLSNMSNVKSLCDSTLPLDRESISRLCEEILPRIAHLVQKLTTEECLAKHVLSMHYPKLYSLSLMHFEEEILYQYLKDDSIFRDIVMKQITHLNINLRNNDKFFSETVTEIFGLILSSCQKLIELNFCDKFTNRKCLTLLAFPIFSNRRLSETLVKLKIHLFCMHDVLILLDGRLKSLSTLNITMTCNYTSHDQEYTGPREKLFGMRCFSFTVIASTFCFTSTIVPLLCRMINLEQLKLNLIIKRCDGSYIDGNELFDGFLNRMTKLNRFTFSIRTKLIFCTNVMELPSNEDIQGTFIGRYNEKIGSYIQINPSERKAQCHIYTVPYEFDHFYEIDEYFPCGVFHKVRYLTVRLGITCEQKFFERISAEFPVLEFLAVSNPYRLPHKQSFLIPIVFPCLSLLDLHRAHVDYAELFLLKTNMSLPRLVNLTIECESLTTITNYFTNDTTNFNFTTVKSLDIYHPFVQPKNFGEYFPLVTSIKRQTLTW